jgi:hypothetical protein
VSGKYCPLGVGAPFTYSVKWSLASDQIRWDALIEGRGVFFKRSGAFNLQPLYGGNAETWVRAAVELEVERIAGNVSAPADPNQS